MLRLLTARRSGPRLLVRGSVAARATRAVTLTVGARVRGRRVRVVRRLRQRSGRFCAQLRLTSGLRRARSLTITLSYAGDARLAAGRVGRRT